MEFYVVVPQQPLVQRLILGMGKWSKIGGRRAVEEILLPRYNQRACCENFIKEGIYGFGLDTSVTRNRAGLKLYFKLVILSYNLMNWFKEVALGCNARKEMAQTIRWKLLWIPARLVRSGRRVKVRLAQWCEVDPHCQGSHHRKIRLRELFAAKRLRPARQIHSEIKKRCSFVALLFAAGDLQRYALNGMIKYDK